MVLTLFAACRRSDAEARDAATTDAAPAVPDGAIDSSDSSDVGACVLDPAAPSATNQPPRHTVPWTLVAALPSADGGAAVGCTGSLAYPSNVACTGAVTVRRTGSGDISLAFADGSILAWSEAVGTLEVPFPPVTDGQTAWAEYARVDSVVCPVCGGYQTARLTIRTSATGPILWLGQEGAKLADLSPDLVHELFGVGVREDVVCEGALVGGCNAFTRQELNHVLETAPEQVISPYTYRSVTTPNGEYGVIWGASVERDVMFLSNCVDSPDVASDNGFAAALTGPPSGS